MLCLGKFFFSKKFTNAYWKICKKLNIFSEISQIFILQKKKIVNSVKEKQLKRMCEQMFHNQKYQREWGVIISKDLNIFSFLSSRSTKIDFKYRRGCWERDVKRYMVIFLLLPNKIWSMNLHFSNWLLFSRALLHIHSYVISYWGALKNNVFFVPPPSQST